MQAIKLCFLLVLCSSLWAGKKTPIGKVTAVEGIAWIVNSRLNQRELKIDSPVYVENVIHVGEDGKVQVLFTDGSVLDLISDTEYAIREYQYKKALHKDHYSAELLKGGFRSLSGSIAKKNPEGYEVKTPTATIGVRGTIIDALLTESGLYVACTKGLAIIMNEVGHFSIGPGETRQYMLVGARNQTPQYFITRPPEMNIRVFTPPPSAIQIRPATAPPPSAPQPKLAPAQEAPQENIGPIGPGATGGETRSNAAGPEDWKAPAQGAGVYIQGGC